jgi:membrane protease YdiL (CAAX protease family)
MQYPKYAAFLASAQLYPAPWRLLGGLVVMLLVYTAGFGVIYGILVAVSGFDGAGLWVARMAEADTPTATLLVLASFIGMGAGAMLGARLLHKRTIASLFGPPVHMVQHFILASVICAIITGLMGLVPMGTTPRPNLDFGLWLSFLPMAVVGILVQTGAEEVLFRGYIQSQLAARFATPLIWMVLPSVLFAMLHFQPSVMGDNAWLVVGAVFLFAVCAADLTARTGTIGAAWGFHFANNAVAILFVALDGPLSGLALYTLPVTNLPDADLRPMLWAGMGITLLIWLVIRVAVGRR